MLTISHSDGVNRSISSLGTLDNCLGQHGAGGTGGTENQNLLFSLWHSSLWSFFLYFNFLNSYSFFYRYTIVIQLSTLSNQSLALYQLLIISTEEWIVNNSIHNQQQWSQEEGQLGKTSSHNQTDSTWSSPRQDIGEGVHAQNINEELVEPYVGDWSQNEWNKENWVQYDRSTKEDWLVNSEDYRNKGAASYSTELLGLSDKGAHGAEHQGCTSTTQGSYEVRSWMSQNSGCVLTSLYHLQVQLDVSNVDSGYGRLYDGRTMNTYEPEHGHSAIDKSDTDITVSSLEQWLEQLQNPVTKEHAGYITEYEAEYPEEGNGSSQREQVSIGLSDVMRNFLRQLDGNATAYKELVDIWYGEGYHESGKQALGTHELSGDTLIYALYRQQQEADDGYDHYGYGVNLTELWQLVVKVVSQALGDGSNHQYGQDTHGITISLPQKTAYIIIPLEVPDFWNAGNQDEQG